MHDDSRKSFNFKKLFHSPLFISAVTSAVTTVAILSIVAAVFWNRGEQLIAGLAHTAPAAGHVVIEGEETKQSPEVPKVLSVTDVVRVANPAVVSIEAIKTVPTYETRYGTENPFEDLFPGFSFQFPSREQTGTEEKVVSGGTGFFVSKDGYLVTNRHVVEDTRAKYQITTTDGRKYSASVIARDPVLDVAILKVAGNTFPFLNFGNSDSIELGQSVIAIGFALGEFQNSISTGVISGLSRSIVAGGGVSGAEHLDKVIQTDAAINPGNSGGPLLDMTGKVIGVNVAVAQGSQNVGFALPINSIKPVITSVRQTGRIIRPYLGIRYVQVTKELAKANNLSVEYGVLVRRGQNPTDLAVIPGSPADKAGIVENDILLEIDGEKLDTDTSFANVIRTKSVGQVVVLKVLSRGQTKTVSVKLEAAP